MERKTGTQLELFSKEGESQDFSKTKNTVPFFKRIRAHEKIILILSSIIITGIIAFSLGVEKGKRLRFSENVKPVIPQDTVAAPVKEEVKAAPLPISQVSIAQTSLIEKQNYIIQIASYKTRVSAQKEANNLKKRGFTPLLFTNGEYIAVCVGSFINKEAAQSALLKLKKYYKGCYIRRM